jgi:hypothetical protein
MDKNCGSESKICMTIKNLPFFTVKNSLIEEQNSPQIKQVIIKGFERCETAQVIRKSSANFQWDVRLGSSGPYVRIWGGFIDKERETKNDLCQTSDRTQPFTSSIKKRLWEKK